MNGYHKTIRYTRKCCDLFRSSALTLKISLFLVELDLEKHHHSVRGFIRFGPLAKKVGLRERENGGN